LTAHQKFYLSWYLFFNGYNNIRQGRERSVKGKEIFIYK
jgi:hypothetical protein